jgi:DNA sulfur modification protein DndD
LEVWKKELIYLEKDLNNLEEKAKEIESDFLKRFGFSADSAGGLKEIEIKKIQLSTRKTEIDKEIKQYCSNILPSGLLSNRFNLIIEQIKNERMLREAKIAERSNENLADILLEKLYKPECIMCRKPFEKNKEEYLKKEILTAISSLDKNNKKSLKINPILNLSEREEKRLEASLINKQSLTNLKDLLNEREETIKELGRTENELSKLKIGAEDRDTFGVLQQQRNDVQQNIGRRKQEIRDLDEQIADKINTNNILERELNNLYEKYSQEKGKADLLVKISRIINVLNEFIDKLRISKLEDLRKHIFSMYRTLASKSDLIADIIIDPLTYRISIIDKHKTVINKQNLSAGEKEVFAISLLWGLAKTSNYNLPIVIDTPLARLDSTHRNAIVAKYFPIAGEQVIILSTDTEVDQNYYKKLEPYIARVNHLLFDKYRELTTLEEGYFWEDNNGR